MASAWLRNALFESLEVKAVERKTPRSTVFFGGGYASCALQAPTLSLTTVVKIGLVRPMKRTTLIAAALVIVACNNGATKPVLTQLTDVSSDTKCPTGGVKISAGADTDGNGTLEASEVTQSSELCNGPAGATGAAGATGGAGSSGANGSNGDAGANGAASLINTTILPPGDSACPNGGVRIDYGLDNGDGAGTAANGALESGEVDGSKNVCNGTQPYYPQSVTPPGGPVGTSHLYARGGAGTTSNGGNGSTIDVYFDQGSLGGNTMVFNTGSVDAGFSIPTLAFVAGANPMAVTGTYTLTSYPALIDGVDSGLPYFQVQNDTRVYSADAGLVTSISVASGAVLTIDAVTSNAARLVIAKSFKNAGTILTKGADPINGTSLSISAATYVSDDTAAIVVVGLDGGSGGSFNLNAGGGIVLAGRVDTFGRASGSGGAFNLNSQNTCVSTATIRANGGSSAVDNGQPGGDVQVHCASLFVAGSIDASGGSGPVAGSASSIGLYANSGDLIGSAQIIARGGACNSIDCVAGSGSSVSIQAAGGELRWAGSVITVGGAASNAPGNQGGSGGSISFRGSPQDGRAARTMRIGGDVDTSGGEGPNGGSAGSINIELNPGYVLTGQQLILYGYAEIDSSGGPSIDQTGGRSGTINLSNTSSRIFDSAYGPGGSVVNYVKITSRGGDGRNAGRSRGVNLNTQPDYPFGYATEAVINYGDITLGSGNSSSQPVYAYAGNLNMGGESGVENHGTVSVNGGTQSGGPSTGGNGGSINLYSNNGPVTNTGALHANAGSATGAGGYGGSVSLWGTVTSNSAAVTATGGNSTVQGGVGGEVSFTSYVGQSANTGSVVVSGGNGTPPGQSGTFTLDGVNQ